MLRRLFFLFPDEEHTQRVVKQLVFDRHISERKIHAVSHGVALKTLPEATQRQKSDTAFRVERFLWQTNLLLFVFALVGFFVSLALTAFFWSFFALATMVITFFAGEHFVVHVPDVHLTEFSDALSHGEILLMVDVPSNRVVEIENFVHHRHPEAVVGGVSWTVDAFGI